MGLPRKTGHPSGGADRTRGGGWCWKRAFIPVCSRIKWPVLAERRSPGFTPSSACACAETLIDAVEAATQRSAELASLAAEKGGPRR